MMRWNGNLPEGKRSRYRKRKKGNSRRGREMMMVKMDERKKLKDSLEVER